MCLGVSLLYTYNVLVEPVLVDMECHTPGTGHLQLRWRHCSHAGRFRYVGTARGLSPIRNSQRHLRPLRMECCAHTHSEL